MAVSFYFDQFTGDTCYTSQLQELQVLTSAHRSSAKITPAFSHPNTQSNSYKYPKFAQIIRIMPTTAQHTAVQSQEAREKYILAFNATKYLAGIDHAIKLIPQEMIEPIQYTKINYLQGRNPRLHTDEVLVALSVLSLHDDNCRKTLAALPKLAGCQVNSTVMLSEVDRKIFRKLGIELTCDPIKK